MKIFLDIASYDCLRENLSPELMRRSGVNAAVLLGNTRVLDCDEMQARELLLIARSDCPGAVARVAEAIRAAGIDITIVSW